MYRFENLNIWKEAVELANKIYDITEHFPKHEMYGLTSQLRRAAVSISSNIAEGAASDSVKEFRNYLNYSIRSVAEVVSELYFAGTRQYINQQTYADLYESSEILIKRITAFRRKLA